MRKRERESVWMLMPRRAKHRDAESVFSRVSQCVRMCVWVCVCERERERKRLSLRK